MFSTMKKTITLFIAWMSSIVLALAITFPNTATWTASELAPYVGQTITFDQPVYICNNYYSGLTVSMHRIMSPTNQALPNTTAYSNILTLNGKSAVTLNGMDGYHRMGEMIYGLTAKVTSTSSLQYISHVAITGTRSDLNQGAPDVDLLGNHDLLVCAFNLEYYLVENLGTGFGPDNASESAHQHTKIMDALSHIGADIYGFVEIEQGQTALKKLAQSLTATTGKNYSWIDDKGSAQGSYVKVGYVYCSDKVKPFGSLKNNNSGVANRKKMQAFDVIASGERFIFSLNHFKAKSGSATGIDADQGDGQGIFNHSRVLEAQSVLSEYGVNRAFYGDDDILIMGDLNAYGKEDPIITLIDGGMTDLHRYFHADSSYSYTFRGEAGYLDHALCNASLLPQITGMAAYHINSDESDSYTYDKSNDYTMFRSSDHDPVLVGLKLGAALIDDRVPDASLAHATLEMNYGVPVIRYASGGYYRIYNIAGYLMAEGDVPSAEHTLSTTLPRGTYIIHIYVEDTVKRQKLIIR